MNRKRDESAITITTPSRKKVNVTENNAGLMFHCLLDHRYTKSKENLTN